MKEDSRNLKRRYLVWLYKTTKEELDRIDRKFTQLDIDRFMLKELRKLNKKGRFDNFLDEFKTYIDRKEKDGKALKYSGGVLKSDYQFLTLKLATIKKAIVKTLGKQAVDKINALYEEEMTNRILRSTEHR